MKILKIISEHKKRHGRRVFSIHPPHGIVGTLGPTRGASYKAPGRGMKRVEAIVEIFGLKITQHVDVPLNFTV